MALVFSFNTAVYGIDLSRESHLRAPLLFGKDAERRRTLLKILALGTGVAAVTKTGFAQTSGATGGYDVQKEMMALYATNQGTREDAAKRLLEIASRNTNVMAGLLEFLINETLRAEAGGKKLDSSLSSMLIQLLQDQRAPGILFNIFKYGINPGIRAKALIFFWQIYTGNQQMVVGDSDLLYLCNALMERDMHHASQTILSLSAQRNPDLKDILIKELLAMRELTEIRNNNEALGFLDEALDEIATTPDLTGMLRGLNYNIRLQIIKRLAKAKNLSRAEMEYDTEYIIIAEFLSNPKTQELAIAVLTKIAPKHYAFLAALLGESLLADVFSDTKTSDLISGTMRQLINESEDMVEWFGLLGAYNPAELPKILGAISRASDEALRKIEFISIEGEDKRKRGLTEAEVALSMERVEQLINLSIYPQCRNSALSILYRIHLNYEGLDELLEKIKETYPHIYEDRQRLLLSNNGFYELLDEVKKTYPDIDRKRQQFMDRLAKAIKNPETAEKDIQAYLDNLLSWGGSKSITGEEFLRYRAIGLEVDLSDLFTLLDNPQYRDIRPQIFKKIASTEDLGPIQRNPMYIKMCIDGLRDPALQEASAHILSGIQIYSLRARLYLIETLFELRNNNVEIRATEDITGRQIDALSEGKSDEEIDEILTARLLSPGYDTNIGAEVIKRLSSRQNININLSPYGVIVVKEALQKYPEGREYLLKLLKAAGVVESEIAKAAEQANKSGEAKGVITIAQEYKKGDMIDLLFERHATSIDILRVAHETKDYKVRHQALSILSKTGNLNVAFQSTPEALETVIEELNNSELRQAAHDILTKITDPYLKRIASGILLIKTPYLFRLDDVTTTLEQEGTADPGIRRKALDMLAERKNLINIQAGYKTAQILVDAIKDPSTRDSSASLLTAFRIGNIGLRHGLIKTLISEKIIVDIKGDSKSRGLLASILRAISSQKDGIEILLDIARNELDPQIVKEAKTILEKNGSYGDAGLALGAIVGVYNPQVSRGAVTGVPFIRALLSSI